MPYEEPRIRTKRMEGWGYGRRFGARDLSKDEVSLHETVSVYRIRVPLGRRYRDQFGNTISDYCPQDGSVEIKWTEWMWTKTGGGPGGNNLGDGAGTNRGRGGGGGSGSGGGGSGAFGSSPEGIGSGLAGSSTSRPQYQLGRPDGAPMSWDAVNNDQGSPTSAYQQTPQTKPLPPTSQNPPDFHDAYITGQPGWQPIHGGGNASGGSNSSNSWWGNYGNNNSGTNWSYQGGSNWGQGGWYQDPGNWSWSSYETFRR